MRYTILMILLYPLLCFSQTNFSKGYEVGFVEGYCYQSKQNGNVGCIEPIAPISPLSDISKGESESNYQDGYHRGFEDGKMNFLTQNTSQKSNPLYTPREYPKVYEPDLLTLMGMVIQQRKTYQSYIDNVNKYYDNLQIQFLVNNQKLLEQAIGYYNSIDKKTLDTLKLKDGWHEIVVIFDNKYQFTKSTIKEVNIAKGYIENGRLIRLYRNNYLGYESKLPQTYPNEMLFERGMVNLNNNYSDGFKQEIILLSLTQYVKSNYEGVPPFKPANIILWSKKKKLEGKEVEIDEIEDYGWINNIVKTKIIYSKTQPKNCNCQVKPGKIEFGLAKKSNGKFAGPITDSKDNAIYIDNRWRRIQLSSSQCLKIEYK